MNWYRSLKISQIDVNPNYKGEDIERAALIEFQKNSALQEWASETTILDKNGLPQIVYHGTGIDEDFTRFEEQRTAYGFFFSPDYDTAAFYGYGEKQEPTETRDEAGVMSAILLIKNPCDLTDDVEVKQHFINAFGGGGTSVFKMDDYTNEYVEVDDGEAQKYLENLIRSNDKNVMTLFSGVIKRAKESAIKDGQEFNTDYFIDYLEWEEPDEYSAYGLEEYLKLNPDREFIISNSDVEEAYNAYQSGSQDFYMNYQDDLMQYANANGYDGVILYDPSSTGAGISYVVFSPNQIKVIVNKGTRDKPDIHFA